MKQDTGRRQGPNKFAAVTSACALFHLYAGKSSDVRKINTESLLKSPVRS